MINGWKGTPGLPDPFTAKVLLIVNEAGKDIDYKHAARMIDILDKERDENGQSNK